MLEWYHRVDDSIIFHEELWKHQACQHLMVTWKAILQDVAFMSSLSAKCSRDLKSMCESHQFLWIISVIVGPQTNRNISTWISLCHQAWARAPKWITAFRPFSSNPLELLMKVALRCRGWNVAGLQHLKIIKPYQGPTLPRPLPRPLLYQGPYQGIKDWETSINCLGTPWFLSSLAFGHVSASAAASSAGAPGMAMILLDLVGHGNLIHQDYKKLWGRVPWEWGDAPKGLSFLKFHTKFDAK